VSADLWSNLEHAQRWVSRGDLVVIVVLGDDGESAFDRGGGDQGIGELDHTVNSSDPAVRNQSRPADHHGLVERNRVCGPRQRERVGATRDSRRLRR